MPTDPTGSTTPDVPRRTVPDMGTPVKLPRMLWVVLGSALFFGAIAGGAQVATALAARNKDLSDKATANRQTCLAVQNARWRTATSVFLVAYSGTPQEVAALARKLHLEDTTVAGLKQYARQLQVGVLLDDQRIGARLNELCPYVPGSPSRTPDKPVTTAGTSPPTTR